MEFEDYFNLDKYNWKKESFQFFINFLINFKDSDGLGEIRQLFLFFLNSINNKKEIINEIVSKAKISDFIFNLMYGNYITMNFMNISKKFIWLFFGSEIKILEGKKTDDEYLSLDMFIEGSNNTFRSIFTKREIIIINIELFTLFFIDKKLTIEQFKKEKNKITETKNKKELTLYICVKNKIINFNNSFELLLNELINLKFFEEQNTNEEIRNIEQVNKNKDDKNDENKIYDTKEIDDLKLELKKEKEINQKLVEKINKLENELNLEKMKNKEFEKQLINKNELNNKINLESNIQEKEKSINKESIELFYEAIMEKDKELKELKLKLARYPFELMEGEKIMSIILSTVDQKIHHSIICKNKEKFNIIENKFYEAYPDYIETENFFTLNGKKINKYKTLDENNIKNNDIILLNVFE